jgi:rod shape determining protein RodA
MKQWLRRFGSVLLRSDILLLILCLINAVFGLFILYSATRTFETERYMTVQIGAVIIGVILFFILTVLDADLLTQRWYILLVISIGLILSLRFWGVEGGTGNKSWLRFFGIGIQPSELAKLSFVLLLARQLRWAKERQRGLNALSSVFMLVVHFGLFFILIIMISADWGSALVFFIVFAAMCFAAGLHLLWFLAGLGAIAAVAPYVWSHVLSEYHRQRILAPFVPDLVDPDGLGITWQVNQSKIALASGGITGHGWLQGVKSQSAMLPFKHTDFIFAVAGEELGLIGCGVIVLLLTVIILRILYVGLHSGSTLDLLICIGVASWFTFQSFENIGMCIGIAPVVGITLPFYSYGGSSMVACFAAAGLISGIRFRARTRSG